MKTLSRFCDLLYRMKTSRGVIISCLLAAVALSCESAHQKLKSLDHLKNIDFGHSVPKHSLLLLHWFANTVDVDNNGVVRLTFDPNTEEFGSHHYGNFEDLLDPLPLGHVRYRYYTVGNLHTETSNELPAYVRNPPLQDYEGTNRDRIIFRVREQNTGDHTIDQVYLTQHYHPHEHRGTRYNPAHTYQISTRLMRQIRMFSAEQSSLTELRDHFHSNADAFQLRDFRNTWGQHLACIGLLLFIVIQEKYSNSRPSNNRHQSVAKRNTQADYVVNIPNEWETYSVYYNHSRQSDQVQLQVVTGTNGNARILWRNVPQHRLREGVAVVLFKNQEDQEASNTYQMIQTREGSHDTSVPLNEGLQVRLHKAKKRCIFWTKVEEEICRGTSFPSPETVAITGYNAYLQLFVRDGKACARLYVKRSFTQWRSDFEQSWVGFYKSAEENTNNYEWWQWQWATKFKECPDSGDYNVFEYYSGMTVASGVQARFILRDYIVKAHTPTWC